MISIPKAMKSKEKNVSSTSESDIRLRIPMPPSVNSAYTNVPGVGRVKTKEYREWIKNCKKHLLTQKKYSIDWDEWLDVVYIFHWDLFMNKWGVRKWDTFNYEKALSDFLTLAIPGFRDEKILDWHVHKREWDPFVDIIIRETTLESI
jgi:Holliday junction resolvase RusA-like endonuclease